MNIDAVVKNIGEAGAITGEVLRQYLTENIDYNLNEEKKTGLKLFLYYNNLIHILTLKVIIS